MPFGCVLAEVDFSPLPRFAPLLARKQLHKYFNAKKGPKTAFVAVVLEILCQQNCLIR
jgi:hypothetical protein